MSDESPTPPPSRAADSGRHSPFLVSPKFDAAWFAGPGVVAVLGSLVLLQVAPRDPGENLWLWIGAVLLVDVAHVYASLYRTYFDPVARQTHRRKLIAIPLACLWFGALIHLASPLAFWSVLAYLAVFHFIKQHVGFAALYLRAGSEPPDERRYVRAAVWAGTLAPVIYWHTKLPREFAWFTQADFVPGLPAWVGFVALWLQLPVLLLFVWRRVKARGEGRRNPMLAMMVLLPALSWNMGIVWFNDDRVFTLTNVMLHGVPYLALVWIAGGRERVAARVDSKQRRPMLVLAVYYGLLVFLATAEEGLWDRWVWHDHPMLFGESTTILEGLPLALVVAALTLPQATHYMLDRFIWRPGPDNPELAGQLGLTPPTAPSLPQA